MTDILIGLVIGLAWVAAASAFDPILQPSRAMLFHGSWAFYGAILSATIFILTNGLISAGVAFLVTCIGSAWGMIAFRRQSKDAEFR